MARVTANNSLDSGLQLIQVERLNDKIVGADVEAGEATGTWADHHTGSGHQPEPKS